MLYTVVTLKYSKVIYLRLLPLPYPYVDYKHSRIEVKSAD